MEHYDVKLLDLAHGTEISAAVTADEGETSDDIILRTEIGGNAVEARAEGYLQAYQVLRDRLLQLGFGLRCSGSQINAVQSAMMAYVPKVYLVQPGKQALQKDIAGIWDYCGISAFPDTEAQNAYTEKWFDSLKAD